MDNMLIELENTLIRKFMNIDIQNYGYENFQDLFYLIKELVNRTFITCSYNITDTSLDSEHIHIMLKGIQHQNAFKSTLSILLNVQDFNIQDIEVSLLH
ncbi:hypothetical protein [Clostridium beijerinckii]|uniref:hypothetical protein n=1 Tax=Clostridium beijerinckii TaxID=1520 RepID=UPI0022E0E60B|nr:hypothetical protein [Clostridium beijerinckii]